MNLKFFLILFIFGVKNVLATTLTFTDVSVGTIIAPEHYQAQGVMLSTNPGQHLYTVASFGINSGFGPSLAASGDGKINIQFVIPGTMTLGGVNTSALMILDNNPGSANYTVTSYDVYNQEMIQIGNNHNYLAGDGYSQEPPTHRIEFIPANPATQFLNSIGFGQIKIVPEPSLALNITLGMLTLTLRRRRC
jgi:hypothetical protein